ncbi:3 beta-hydroxysteroid dehydrogenase type 7 [Bagarius yarrelli]|uniref:3 beta-hydroxysteroid dehydrogenase type 7 n=1 Tax=Bagarius yarrelli TaxID=175774 RepID=A0A556UZP1_BAGYA|nr:3 beta-hydroxysteroid dehydrogenase type 7 [Bagarius yarrelli]
MSGERVRRVQWFRESGRVQSGKRDARDSARKEVDGNRAERETESYSKERWKEDIMSTETRELVYVLTGGCGFLGQHLLKVLLEKEEKLKEIRLFDKHVDWNLQTCSTDYSSVLEACRGADLVIHSASLVDVWYRVPEEIIYSVNVGGIYGENHQLMKEFYMMGVRTCGWLIKGVPRSTEHGRVYAGNVAWMHVLAAQALRKRPERLGGEVYFCYDDSPHKSYEEFNMQFLSVFNFRSLRMPLCMLWMVACFNELLRWMLRPVCNFAPMLNRYTLAIACTSFTVCSDKALRHFGYRPLYDWPQCRERTQRWVNTFRLNADQKNA